MSYKQQAPMWPLLGVLSCLFVLSVTAPRSWERIARQKPVDDIEARAGLRNEELSPGIHRENDSAEFFIADNLKGLVLVPHKALNQLTLAPPQDANVEGSAMDAVTTDAVSGAIESGGTGSQDVTPHDSPSVGASDHIQGPIMPRLAAAMSGDTSTTAVPESQTVEAAPARTELIIPQGLIAASVGMTPPTFSEAEPWGQDSWKLEATQFDSSTSWTLEEAFQRELSQIRPRCEADSDASRIDVAVRPQRATKLDPQDLALPPLDAKDAESTPGGIPPAVDPGIWEVPPTLLDRLHGITACQMVGPWALGVGQSLRELAACDPSDSEEAGRILARLRGAADSVAPLLVVVGEGPLAVELRRARHGLVRRLDVWDSVNRLHAKRGIPTLAGCPDRESLEVCLSGVDRLAADSATGQSWREFLFIEGLAQLSRDGQDASDDWSREMARRVLRRMHRTPMTQAQRQVLEGPELAALNAELSHWAASPVLLPEVIAHLEKFEQSGLSSDARQLAEVVKRLEYSPEPEARRLRNRLETHYRNCNVRVAVSERLLNRMLPEQGPVQTPTNTRILGIPVRGTSNTTTDLALRLSPSDDALRFALEARGTVNANTRARERIATVYSRSHSNFVVQKPIVIRPNGARGLAAEIDVDLSTQLSGVETTFDPVPLLGWIVRRRVEGAYEQRQSEARREAQRQMTETMRERIDEESHKLIDQANQRLEQDFQNWLQGLSLERPHIEMRTTPQRLIVRTRLANENQLGANTPRPRAPSDSLVSVQVHESAINNVLGQLELDGLTFTVRELHFWVADKLGLPLEANLAEQRDDVRITFAPRDAIQVHCQDGRLEITLSIAKVDRDYGRDFHNIQVRVFYRPDPASTRGELVRDGVVQLIGYRLGASGQVGLRGVFSKMFAKERRWAMVPERFAQYPQLAHTEVVQHEIADGWMALALADPRVADKALAARQAPTTK